MYVVFQNFDQYQERRGALLPPEPLNTYLPTAVPQLHVVRTPWSLKHAFSSDCLLLQYL